MDSKQLSDAIKIITERHWASKKQPTLLSALPELLNKQLGEDFRNALDGGNLKTFIQSESPQSGYKLVEHPNQRAKIGVLPADEFFDFVPTFNTSTNISTVDAQAFIRVLSALSEEERKAMTLPATLVVKLLTAK